MVQVHDALRERARLRGAGWWLDDLSRLVAAKKPGDTVTLTVFRDGEETNLQVTLGEKSR